MVASIVGLMRPVILSALLAGCAPVCPGPSQVDGTWAVFANVLSRTGGDEPAFPVESTPTNGETVWSIAWGAAAQGSVDLAIDGQPVQASGRWSTEACGTFELALDGTYSHEGASHTFEARGTFLVYQDSLDGTWDWTEQWRAATDETGVFTARGQIQGDRL